MACTLDKVLLEQRINVFVWVEEEQKIIPISMAPATFRNFKKFAEELRKSSRLGEINDDTARQIWDEAVEEVLARLHLNTFTT